MNCHACGHEESAPFAFCPSCGTRPLATTKADRGGDKDKWAANPRIAADHKGTMAMGAVSAPAGGFSEPNKPTTAPKMAAATPKVGGGVGIMVAVLVLAGLGALAYYLATF